MKMNREEAESYAEYIVLKVLDDLHGRKGVGNELDNISHYIYIDMVSTLNEKVANILCPSE